VRLQVGFPGSETFPGRVGGGWPVGGRKKCLVGDRRLIRQRGVVLPVKEGAGSRTVEGPRRGTVPRKNPRGRSPAACTSATAEGS